MAFGSQNLLMAAGLAGVALAMTAVVVPHIPQVAMLSAPAGESQKTEIAAKPRLPEPPIEGSGSVAGQAGPPAPVEVPLVAVIPPDPAPREAVRVAPPAPVEVQTTAALAPLPDIRVSSPGNTPMDCLPEGLKRILQATALRFGFIELVSTTHLHTDNHNAGRAKIHADCMAADIRAPAAPDEVLAFIRTQPGLGGVGTYKNGVIHLDDASAHPPDAYAKRPSARGESPSENR